ncbi:MAG: hypothetical protein D6796_02090 [Caldilineae bacterium]|nr:MAG: hypothetical protein D6796_02090 [Caldilineae bacterium]
MWSVLKSGGRCFWRETFSTLILRWKPTMPDRSERAVSFSFFRRTAGRRFQRWRPWLTRAATVVILGAFGYWSWRNWDVIRQVTTGLDAAVLAEVASLMMGGVFLFAFAFTLLVRSFGYRLEYRDGYHILNLAQIAAMIPGRVWGLAGLMGLLWAKGISRRDSVLVIFLHTLFILSAAVVVGGTGLALTVGWGYTLLGLGPVLVLLLGYTRWEALRGRYFAGSTSLPSPGRIVVILATEGIGWGVLGAAFALFVRAVTGGWAVSPWLAMGTFPAGYVGGYLSLLTPSGLGVREGIIALILGPALGSEKALALAIVFRVLHMAVLWFNVVVTLLALSRRQSLLNEGETSLDA